MAGIEAAEVYSIASDDVRQDSGKIPGDRPSEGHQSCC